MKSVASKGQLKFRPCAREAGRSVGLCALSGTVGGLGRLVTLQLLQRAQSTISERPRWSSVRKDLVIYKE
jgi:hypothetical protein